MDWVVYKATFDIKGYTYKLQLSHSDFWKTQYGLSLSCGDRTYILANYLESESIPGILEPMIEQFKNW